MQHQVTNLVGSLDGSPPVLAGAAVEGPNGTVDQGLAQRHAAVSADGVDVVRAVQRPRGTVPGQRAVVLHREPAIDLTASSPLAFARQAEVSDEKEDRHEPDDPWAHGPGAGSAGIARRSSPRPSPPPQRRRRPSSRSSSMTGTRTSIMALRDPQRLRHARDVLREQRRDRRRDPPHVVAARRPRGARQRDRQPHAVPHEHQEAEDRPPPGRRSAGIA